MYRRLKVCRLIISDFHFNWRSFWNYLDEKARFQNFNLIILEVKNLKINHAGWIFKKSEDVSFHSSAFLISFWNPYNCSYTFLAFSQKKKIFKDFCERKIIRNYKRKNVFWKKKFSMKNLKIIKLFFLNKSNIKKDFPGFQGYI